MKLKDYFSKHERMLWGYSVLLIIVSFCLFDRTNYMTLCASLIGVTSLIFNAKGNPFGQFLMVIFSLLYGMISYTFGYYGEMITYLGMTMPMAIFALAYASNDVVLILLWGLASMSDVRYIAVVACFVAFLVNDIYGFVSWRKMKIRQQEM